MLVLLSIWLQNWNNTRIYKMIWNSEKYDHPHIHKIELIT
jgi:hypothetical protein